MVAASRFTRRLRRSCSGLTCSCLVLMIAFVGCGRREPAATGESPAADPRSEEDPGPRELRSFDSEIGMDLPWTGDLEGMIEREYIRALVVYNKTQYFIDQGAQRGVTYEGLREFENWLNKRLLNTYGERYGLDPLLLAATGYQESHLDQTKRSHAGAVGVMQIRPATAADPNVGIKDIHQLENDIHAGAKYLAFLRDRYFSEPEIGDHDRAFLTLAAYNAGPARVRSLRAEAAATGLDPNVWYRNVEIVAAKQVGSETVRYVSNITKYWIAYRMVADRQDRIEDM